MKPGSRDVQHKIRIAGRELVELKRFTDMMTESFGLDRRIEAYQGKRPIGFWRWDLDCLEDVIDLALKDERNYPRKAAAARGAMESLQARIKRLRMQAYADIVDA